MSEVSGPPGSYKTIGVQLPNGLHSQATMVAKLDGISLRDACVRGLRTYVEQKQAEPDFKARVAAALADIEREAAEQREAIQSLFGSETQAAAPAAKKTTAAKKAAESSPPTS
ncbi:hypothetical protein [Kribbella monticola]|uniref:hypothetical protein n=1 Tax=Kribbella monticola TaxID=2185285 RepID=UPI0018E522C8|nr:hypothetical protein [Kribbella monticola]